MWQAHKLGAHIVKLLPGAAGVPAFVRAVRGPLPFLKIVPTTGVTEENCDQFMKVRFSCSSMWRSKLDVFAASSGVQLGVFGVGFTAVLFDADDMANERWGAIEERARRMSSKVCCGLPCELHRLVCRSLSVVGIIAGPRCCPAPLVAVPSTRSSTGQSFPGINQHGWVSDLCVSRKE